MTDLEKLKKTFDEIGQPYAYDEYKGLRQRKYLEASKEILEGDGMYIERAITFNQEIQIENSNWGCGDSYGMSFYFLFGKRVESAITV
ncbi:hypothetical protein LCGC14_0370830 [marine sediment metagenome]|uniref:Uncharacterized protein n=1 Tax=marine sediment metagenome TaxID=412755 RepID=A0A0F9TN92_9ZZZZ|nr:hypothetical protein [Maribacter sp.]HDZ04845.1 hypothetical protein [Maribacter sp.]